MKITENLYLSKKKNHKVLIDTGRIAQHQIDGIRFLHRQFVMGKPGIVFNDPWSCDRSDSIQQIILFLEAVKSELETPALILCNVDDISKWLEHFQQRMEPLNVVALENPKPWMKDIVYIYDMANISKLSRDGWSFVIVDDDAVSKQMLKTVLKAKFKIWITSLDMKNYLHIFASIYQWLYPNDKFTIEAFTGSNSDTLNEVDKEIMLDVFLEDIVLRRNDLKLSVPNKTQNSSEPGDINLIDKNATRKNKDVTGTKIKRTKRKVLDSENNQILKTKRKNIIDSDSEDFVVSSEKDITVRAENNSTMTNNKAINVDFGEPNQQTSKLDEFKSNFNFILNNEIETSRENATFRSDKDSMSYENISEIETDNYPDSSNNSKGDIKVINVEFQEMSQETMCFRDAIQDIVDHENTVVSEMNNEIDVTINTENETHASRKISNNDSKHSALDEIIMKKFKGTLLDRIFS